MKDINFITGQIVDAAMTIHSTLGPGLLESAYESCLFIELHKRGLKVVPQVVLPFVYEGVKVDAGYRIDLLIEDCVIVEVKAIEKLLPVHEAQLVTYLKLNGSNVGLLMNFNVVHMKDGIKRKINNLDSSSSLGNSGQ